MTYSLSTTVAPTLSDEQQAAVAGIINKEIRILMGSAGTGKGEVIAEVERQLGDKCMIVTPTHKAQIALMEKGVKRVQQTIGLTRNKFIQNKLNDLGVTHIIVDEASMVERKMQVLISEYIAKHKTRDIHVTFIGDPMQLDPISENAEWLRNSWFADETPDFILTEGFRQDANVSLKVVANVDIDPNSATICMTNFTRNQVNLKAHIAKWGKDAYTSRKKAILKIHSGDKLVSYFTDVHQTVRNNCTYTVRKVEDYLDKDKGECFKVWLDNKREFTLISKSMFRVRNHEEKNPEKREWEFAYAMTAHSAQGSGFDNVIVYLERELMDDKTYSYPLADVNIQKWLYTAITRGKKSITVVDPTDAIEDDGLSLDMTTMQSYTPAPDLSVGTVTPVKVHPAPLEPQEAPVEAVVASPAPSAPEVRQEPVAPRAVTVAPKAFPIRYAVPRAKYFAKLPGLEPALATLAMGISIDPEYLQSADHLIEVCQEMIEQGNQNAIDAYERYQEYLRIDAEWNASQLKAA